MCCATLANTDSDRSEGLRGFLDEILLDQEREEEEDTENKRGVTLITMHAAKGLEFPNVYIVGVEEGILPHDRSKAEGALDEERRLLYVGITRAMRALTMTHCRARLQVRQLCLLSAELLPARAAARAPSADEFGDLTEYAGFRDQTPGAALPSFEPPSACPESCAMADHTPCHCFRRLRFFLHASLHPCRCPVSSHFPASRGENCPHRRNRHQSRNQPRYAGRGSRH